MSIFALDCADALQVFDVAAAFDATDPYSCSERPVRSLDGLRFAIPHPEQLEFGADGEYRSLYDAAIARLHRLGAIPIEIDFAPFVEVRRLLYEGPWIAERLAAIEPFYRTNAEHVHPVVMPDVYRGPYRSDDGSAGRVAVGAGHVGAEDQPRDAGAERREDVRADGQPAGPDAGARLAQR